MLYYNFFYEMTFILIVNILHTGLLKRAMDSFLVLGHENQKIIKPVFVLYYLITTVIYGIFHVSVVYELCNAAGILGIACFYQSAWKKKLWISLSFLCMDMGCLLTVYFACANKVSGPENAVWILLLLICVMVISHITEPAEEKETSVDTKQMLLLIFIPVLAVSSFGSMMYGSVDKVTAAFLCIVMVALNLCVFYLYHVLQKNYVQLREQDIYRQQTLAYQNQLDVIMKSQNRIRALKHDMKNHVLTLQALAKDSQSEELSEYLASMQEFMVNPSEYVFTGNEALDSLLNYKLQKAKEILKIVETDIVIPEQVKLHSFDLNVIVGNLLDNAIAASEQTEEQFLEFSMRMEKGILFLHMINSCVGIPNGVCDIQKMAEKSVEGHGIGLTNVERIVEKYYGDMEMNCESNRMETDIMLYIKKL
ncbi:MAG: GHKL domain-containing protein [Clostridium sp.]|nr:GHKL domain-containing protein [Clostridium sp.]